MKIWDILFGLFVLAPIATGGIWYRGPNLKLEYTQPGIAALILSIWAFFAWKRGQDLSRSFFLRFIERSWKAWRVSLERGPWPLVLAWIFVSIAWFLAALNRHRGFETHAADLGIFTNAIWNLAQTGSPYSSIKGGISLLADHQNFLIYPIAAIYKLLPHPSTLLAIQALGLSSAGIALFLLGRQRLKAENHFVPMLPLLFWACAPIRAANLFDFHPEVLMLPLFLFAAWGVQAPKPGARLLGILLFLTALTAKESAGPVACGLGLAWILGAGPEKTRSFSRAFGGFAVLLGIGIFLFDTKAIPQFLGTNYAYGNVYEPFGSSLTDLIKAPFTHPLEFLERVFGFSRIKFFSRLLFPFLFLPLLGWPGFIASLPGFMMLFLAAGDQRLSGFHYSIEPMVGVLFALPAALATRFVGKHARLLLLLLPLAALLQFGRSEIFHWRKPSWGAEQTWLRDRLAPAVHPERSVSANSPLVPHLSNRQWVHHLPVLETEKGRPVECVAWDRSLNQTPMNDAQMQELENRLQNYELELRCGPFTLHRAPEAPTCLSYALECNL